MAVAIDIGERHDIHPKNKQDVGLRLGLAARAVAYGEKIVYSGPVFRQSTREGAALRLWFDHTGDGLSANGLHADGLRQAVHLFQHLPGAVGNGGKRVIGQKDAVKAVLEHGEEEGVLWRRSCCCSSVLAASALMAACAIRNIQLFCCFWVIHETSKAPGRTINAL